MIKKKTRKILLCNCNVIGPSRPKIGVSTQNPGLKFIAVDDDGGAGAGGAVDDEEEVAKIQRRKKNNYK